MFVESERDLGLADGSDTVGGDGCPRGTRGSPTVLRGKDALLCVAFAGDAGSEGQTDGFVAGRKRGGSGEHREEGGFGHSQGACEVGRCQLLVDEESMQVQR